MFGFLPFGLAATRYDDAWLGGLLGIGWRWLTATGAVLEGRGAFFYWGDGLAFQAKLEHFLGEDFTNLDDEIFELR